MGRSVSCRLREGGRAAIGAVVRLAVRAAVVPLVGVVAFEVGAPLERVAAAVVVGVLEPGR